jgi:hypothetical protein
MSFFSQNAQTLQVIWLPPNPHIHDPWFQLCTLFDPNLDFSNVNMIVVLHLTHSPMPLHIHMVLSSDTPPHFLKDSNVNPKVKIMEKKVGVHSLARNILGVEGHVRAPGWGLGQVTSMSIIDTNLHKPNNKLVSAWLEHFWCMDKPWAYTDSQDSLWPKLEGSHHLHPYSILNA